MNAVERRFHHPVALAAVRFPGRARIHVPKGYSAECVAALIAAGQKRYFDLVYVDGSHQATDVQVDAVPGFRLLKVRGVIAFDDYLWSEALP